MRLFNGACSSTCLAEVTTMSKLSFALLFHRARYAFLAFASVVVACGGSDGTSGGSTSQPTSCTKSTDCPIMQCQCADGSASSSSICYGSECADASPECKSNCSAHGGVTSFQPFPESWATILASSQCQAYCAKYNSVFGSCPAGGNFMATCDPVVDCGPEAGECPAALDARLKCEVDTGTWSCSGIAYNCSTAGLCGG